MIEDYSFGQVYIHDEFNGFGNTGNKVLFHIQEHFLIGFQNIGLNYWSCVNIG